MAILKNLTQEKAELERLRAEVARLKADQERPLKFKVSTKGAVSVYGLGRWPVTLYKGQWETLIASMESITAFIEANKHLLATKGDADAD